MSVAGAAMVTSGVQCVRAGVRAAAAASARLDAVALIVCVVSIVAKELLFRATYAVGERARSPSLVANAHHHRSDAMSSVAAAVGAGGALAGLAAADSLAAAVVGVMVLKLGVQTAAEALEVDVTCIPGLRAAAVHH